MKLLDEILEDAKTIRKPKFEHLVFVAFFIGLFILFSTRRVLPLG
jgi:hypothetical protein